MTEERIKILFVIPSLRAGGAERVMSFVAQNLDPFKFDSRLLVVGFEKDRAFDIKDLKVTYLNSPRVGKSVFKIISHLRSNKPDIVVSAIGHVNILMSLVSIIFPSIKFIGRETNVKSIRIQHKKKKKRFGLNLHKLSFKLLDAIICQSKDMLDDLINYDQINTSKFVIINNPISDTFSVKVKKEASDVIQYITIGALHPRKGHDRILKALSNVDHAFHYTIIGKGDYDLIKFKIKDLNLGKHITYIEYTNDVPSALSKCDVFLNGSYVEGFSNAMIESCAVGIPVIAFDAPGGINEIIIKGVNGYIAQSENDFIGYLNSIQNSNPFNRKIVSDSVMSRYGKDVIIPQYESLFFNLFHENAIK